MSVAKYLFGGDTNETPDSLKRKRRLAEAMVSGISAPKDFGSGLSAVGQALLYRSLMGDLKAGEADSAALGAKAFQSGLTGGEFLAAPGKSGNVVKALFGKKAEGEADTSLAPNGDYFSAIRSAESGGNDSAKNPRSSALGRYQFIDSTWQNLAKKYPDLGLTPDGRTDPAQQERAIKAFTADNAAVLQSAGIEPTGGNLYAAHFLGADGARNVLKSDPNASVASIVGQGVVKANPFLSGMTVAQFQQWAARKGGGNGPVNLGGNTQVASLDPSAGLPEFDQYGNIPARDGMGQDQRAKFRAWNSDPAGNEAQNMQGIDPALSKVVERAKQLAGTDFVLGSGRRDQDQQKTAVANGWSGTMDSDHLTGGAADLWPVDENGAVVFDPQKQAQIVQAMKQAAGELGLDMEAGADWKRKDMPHFGMTNQTPMDNAPVPTPRPGGNQVASLDPSIGMPPQNAQPAPQQTAGIFVGTPEEMAAQNQPRVPAQMLDPRAMGVPQEGFAMPQQAPQQPAPDPQPQRVAQSSQMSDADALAALGAQNANAPASRMRDLQMALSNPNLSEQQQTILANELQRVQQESDPVRQMQLEKARLELDALRKGESGIEYKVVNDRLVKTYADGRPPEDATPDSPNGAPADLFGGSSVEAQSLNYLVRTSQITPDQAAQMGAGKTISGPNGEIMFLTPQGVFGQQSGQPPKPLTPGPAGAQAPPDGQPRAGVISLTEPKVTLDEKKAQTFADRMTTSGEIIDSMGMSGSGKFDRLASGVPLVGEYLTSDEFKKVDAAKRDFINAQLRRESGAVIADSEFANAELQYFPQPNDPPEVVEQKRLLRQRVIQGMQRDGGPTYTPPATGLPSADDDPEIDDLVKRYGG